MSAHAPAAALPVLATLYRLFRSQLLLIAVVTALCTGLAVVYALTAKPVYRAETVIVPVEHEGGGGTLSRLVGQFGGFASMADLGLGGMGGSRDEALGVLRSRKLLEEFIAEGNLLPELFPKLWDASAKRWRVSADEQPTVWQGIDLLERQVRYIEEDKRSGRVLLAIEWTDPVRAAAWANELVARANETLRQRSIAAAQKSIEYLQSQTQGETTLELRESVYAAMENQLNAVMLAKARPDYALRVVDPALVPDAREPIKPRRRMLVVAGFVFGVFLAAVMVLAASTARALLRSS
jgi:uncharacterized protein involved in exopolysaccharide biosynthesis